MSVTVYLGLGTNLGDKVRHLQQAIQYIEQQIGSIVSRSAFYETAPWGFQSDNTFLNAAVGVRTTLDPLQLLHATRHIEQQMGRIHKSVAGQYTDRVIDIDLLLYGNHIINEPDLQIPHPLMAERLFVLQPLAEIAADVSHPIYMKTIRELLKAQK